MMTIHNLGVTRNGHWVHFREWSGMSADLGKQEK